MEKEKKTLKIDKELHKKLKVKATEEETTLQELVEYALNEYLNGN